MTLAFVGVVSFAIGFAAGRASMGWIQKRWA